MLKNTSNQRCSIYLNRNSSNPKLFSIKRRGLVTGRFHIAQVKDATFKVNKAGHNRAVEKQVRNVHAYIEVQDKSKIDVQYAPYHRSTVMAKEVHYNYQRGAFFSVEVGNQTFAIDEDYIFPYLLMYDHLCLMSNRQCFEYLLKRKVSPRQLAQLIFPEKLDELINKIKYLLSLEPELRDGHFNHEGFNYANGICGNLDMSFNSVQRLRGDSERREAYAALGSILHYLFSKWTHFSGDITYPIYIEDGVPCKAPDDFAAENQYDLKYNLKWASQFLDLRMDLLRHILKGLET